MALFVTPDPWPRSTSTYGAVWRAPTSLHGGFDRAICSRDIKNSFVFCTQTSSARPPSTFTQTFAQTTPRQTTLICVHRAYQP